MLPVVSSSNKRDRKRGECAGFTRRQFLRLAGSAPLALTALGHAVALNTGKAKIEYIGAGGESLFQTELTA
jgi:hypothetical protein